MERNRDGKRGTMAAVNGISRRRPRGGSSRDFPDEGVGMELKETGRLRGLDRDRSSRNRRAIENRLTPRSNEDDEEVSSDEAMDQDEEEDEATVRPSTSLPPLSSSLSSNHNHVQFNSRKAKRRPVPWKMADEMIGISIPRKARTAYAKRNPEPSASPVLTSPSSSDASIRKKTNQITGSKQRMPKIPKSPSSIQGIEIEVAEVLYGLTRQFQVPTKEDSEMLHSKDEKERSNDSRGSVLHGNDTLVASLLSSTPKRKKPRHTKVEEKRPKEEVVQSSSSVSLMCKTVDGFQVQTSISTKNSDVPSLIQLGKKSENAHHVSTMPEIEQALGQKKERKFPETDHSCDELTTNSAESELKLNPSADCSREKLSADLVAAPGKYSKDGEHYFTRETETGRKNDSFKSLVEKPERPPPTGETQKLIEEHDSRGLINDKSVHVDKEETRNTPRVEPTSEKTDGPFPWPMSATALPGGFPFGYMGQTPLLQPSGPVDGPIRQLRLKRCAIHCYIAHNIFLHQQVAQMNPLWSMAAAKAYTNPNLISPYGKDSNLNSPTETSQRKQPLQVGSTNNMPRPSAFFFPMSQPRAPGKFSGSMEAQYYILQNNGYHPQTMGFLNTSYHHPQWQQLAAVGAPPLSEGFSSSNPKQQQIPLQSMKPETIPQAMTMAYAANLSFQNLPELAMRNGSTHNKKAQPHGDDSQTVFHGGNNYQNALPRFPVVMASSPGPAMTQVMASSSQNCLIDGAHQGQISFEATSVKNSSALVRPNGSSILEKAQIAAPQQQRQLFFTNANLKFPNYAAGELPTTAASGYYFRQAADQQHQSQLPSHSSTTDAVSLSSSAISLVGRSAPTSGDASKTNGVKGLASQSQMPSHPAPMGAFSLSSSSLSTAGRSSATFGDASKVNVVKGLTSQSQMPGHPFTMDAFSLSSSSLSTCRRSASASGDTSKTNDVKGLTSPSLIPSHSSTVGALPLSSPSLAMAGRSAVTSGDTSKVNGVKGLISKSQMPSHPSTISALSFSSSAISMDGRSALIADPSKANGLKVLTSQSQMPSHSSAMGALSLSSPVISMAGRSATTSGDASKVNGVKGLTSPSLLQAAQLSSAAFPYLGMPPVPVRSTQPKPTAGNDSLHPCWQQPEKRLNKTTN